MFLFLSKVLPLFFYPIGFTCLMLLVALVLLWRRSRLTSIPILLAFVVLLASSSGWVCSALAQSLEFQNRPLNPVPQADAIVVLGGCTYPAESPRPWVEVMEEGDRILYAAKLFREGKAPRIILSGGRIDWRGGGPAESSDMAQLMETMGVPKTVMLEDPTSLNTRENAVNVKQIMETQGIRRILLVTSALHMPRSLLIFKKLGIDPIPAPTDYLTTDPMQRNFQGSPQTTILNILPDADRLRVVTRALKEYVGIVIYRLRGWA